MDTLRLVELVVRKWQQFHAGQDDVHDLLFKKPFMLSVRVELMIGAGPQLSYSPGVGTTIVADNELGNFRLHA